MEGGYQCLTCNTLVSDNCITEHLKSTDHINAIVKDDSSPCTGSDEIKAKGSVENKNKQEAERHVVVKDPETKPSKLVYNRQMCQSSYFKKMRLFKALERITLTFCTKFF